MKVCLLVGFGGVMMCLFHSNILPISHAGLKFSENQFNGVDNQLNTFLFYGIDPIPDGGQHNAYAEEVGCAAESGPVHLLGCLQGT